MRARGQEVSAFAMMREPSSHAVSNYMYQKKLANISLAKVKNNKTAFIGANVEMEYVPFQLIPAFSPPTAP
jgi:hypothetical protein